MSAMHDRPDDLHDDQQPDRHLDPVAMVAGLVFLAMALAFSIAELDTIDDQVRYIWPTTLLALGLGMLLGVRRRR